MTSGDFLHKDAVTPLCNYFVAAGALCSLSTNSESVLEAARDSFLPLDTAPPALDFSMRFWVDATATQPPWPQPYVRGLGHLVFAGFDSGSSILADLHTRRVIGRVSPAMAADRAHLKTVVFPILLTIIGASVDLAELHCACVVKEEYGILLVGPGRSGKSTLAVALSQAGFGFLSDDRTFCSWREGKLAAWGLATTLKLREQGNIHFKELTYQKPSDLMDGETGFRLDPERDLGLRRVRNCEPRLAVFLERSEAPAFTLNPISPGEAISRLARDLIAERPDAAAKQMGIITRAAQLPCFSLQYGGDPQTVAKNIASFFDKLCITGATDEEFLTAATPTPGQEAIPPEGVNLPPQTKTILQKHALQREDPLQRLTATPYSVALPVMGRTVRLESNDSRVVENAEKLFARYPGSPSRSPQFLWRILIQSRPRVDPPWPRRSAFSDRGLRFAEFGQRNFIAVDLAVNEGVCFLAEGLAEDLPGFISPFLDTLFYMTAGSLGLVSFSAACVSLRNKGLLVLGPPNQGKTTASYLAANDKFKFHADQTVFLDTEGGNLRAWGDFVPAAFRPEALEFLPELRSLTSQFSYCDFTFHYLDRQNGNAGRTEVVSPIACVFLERGSSSIPQLVPVIATDASKRLSEGIAFQEDGRFETQSKQVLEALEQLPMYHLAYGCDPAAATPYLRRLLMGDGTDGDGLARQTSDRDSSHVLKGA
jgi:hypothetical protein